MKTLKSLLILLAIIWSTHAFAQDMIIKTTQDTIFCKIKEIGSAEIKYLLPDYPQDVSFGIDKEKVRKVIFANGKEMSFVTDMKNPESYAENKKHALKFHLASPLMGNVSFAYEKSLRPGRSMEFGIGYIFGYPDFGATETGIILRAGFKFMRTPDFYVRRMRYSHLLKGSYFKPEIIFNSFSSDSRGNYYSQSTTENITSVSVLFILGKQVVYDNAFLIDFYAGFGYGYTNNFSSGYYYSNSILDTPIPISFTMGFKVGFLFK